MVMAFFLIYWIHIVPMVLVANFPVGTGFFVSFVRMYIFPMVLIAEFPVGTCFYFFIVTALFFLTFLFLSVVTAVFFI